MKIRDFFNNPTVPIKKCTLLLMLASGTLLTVIHPPVGLSWLAWVAWVPFMLACRPEVKLRSLMLCAYLAGLCFWFGNLYWLVIVTTPGYIAFSIVQACYWPLLALSIQFIRQKNGPLFLAAPLIFVGAEAVQGWMFTGFSWYYLAHSQYEHLRLIQICDIFGTLGVSVLIAMVNGVVVDWVLCKNTPRVARSSCAWPWGNRVRPARSPDAIGIAALIGVSLWYGHIRLAETPEYQTEGPVLGSVQPNIAAYVKEEMDNGQEILDELIADSGHCFAAGAKMVCWPETMVLAPMNPDYLSVCVSTNPGPSYQKQIIEYCKDRGYVLFGATTAAIGVRDNNYAITDQYNSAFVYRPDGAADPRIYHKIHLVPFGEYIPFRNISWIHKIFMFFNPYDYDYSLTAGTEYTTFDIEAEKKQYHFGVLICYEDTDPTIARKHVIAKDGTKRCDWLVNLSNDGWYVIYNPENAQTFLGKVKKFILRDVFRIEKVTIPMVELRQRTAISAFRCVENRISIIRSVNTGISCLIEPTGKIRNGYQSGNLPETVMDRQGVAGWFVDTIPLDSRITFFSKHGRWLDVLLGLSWSLILLLSIYTLWKHRDKKLNERA